MDDFLGDNLRKQGTPSPIIFNSKISKEKENMNSSKIKL